MSYSNIKYLYFLIFLLYCAPFVILGQDAYLLIHDTLDSNHSWATVLKNSGLYFAPSTQVIPSLAPLPRHAISFHEFDFISLLYYFFKPFTAYSINFILMHIIAFAGFFLFATKALNYKNNYITLGCALCFSLLPFWPFSNLSVAGLPLLLYVFHQVYHREKLIFHFFILFLFSSYSSLILSGFVYIVLLGAIYICLLLKYKKPQIPFLTALIIYIGSSVLCNYRHFLNLIDPVFISHRSGFNPSTYTFSESIESFLSVLIKSHYHFSSLQGTSIIISIVLAALTYTTFKNKDLKNFKTIGFAVCVILITSMFFALWKNDFFYENIRSKILLLKMFNFSRLITLQPLAWGLAFLASLTYLAKLKKIKYVVPLLILIQIIYSFRMSDFVQNYKKEKITYRQFYDKKMFNEVKNYIDPQYKTLSLGIHPSIALFNGFNCADFYIPNYPMEYKKQFIRASQPEISKNKKIYNYVMNWGSRLYLFSSEAGINFTKSNKNSIDNLEINRTMFKEMGVRYIFSKYKINNGYKLIKHFNDNEFYWKIYLYEI